MKGRNEGPEHSVLYLTAAIAMTPQIRAFRPHFIIIDEASQLTEVATVAVIKRVSTITKAVLMGDPKQIDLFSFDQKIEFMQTQVTSLMVRWTNTGVPVTMFQEQFRMYPHISATVSFLYYSMLLRDSPGYYNALKTTYGEGFIILRYRITP